MMKIENSTIFSIKTLRNGTQGEPEGCPIKTLQHGVSKALDEFNCQMEWYRRLYCGRQISQDLPSCYILYQLTKRLYMRFR